MMDKCPKQIHISFFINHYEKWWRLYLQKDDKNRFGWIYLEIYRHEDCAKISTASHGQCHYCTVYKGRCACRNYCILTCDVEY